MLVLEIRDPRGALLLPLQPAEQTCGTAKEGLDGAWSFRPFVLLSMAIPSGLSLLSKGCQQLRFCFLNSKIMPVLPFLPFPSQPLSGFLFLLPLSFPIISLPFISTFPFSLSCLFSGKKRGAHATLTLMTSYFFKWLGFSTSLSKLPVSTISSHPSCLCWLLEALLPF